MITNDVTKTIFLIGGGFSTGEHLELDDRLLELTGKPRPKVCFIPTASGDAEVYIERFYDSFNELECEPSHLSLFGLDGTDIDEFIAAQDAVYVGGGSTANLLQLWRYHGLDTALIKAYHRGLVLAGISAGSCCWFDACLTDSFGPFAPLNDGLGLLSGSFCPHYNTEEGRPEKYAAAIQSGKIGPGVALDDGAGAIYINGELSEVIRSDPAANLHHIA